ncbi:MAG: uncharacterized protein JWM77_2081 [Rhodospirillales bacterium]|nr:uncharacterized protein [Rhodospirillales bacterium]
MRRGLLLASLLLLATAARAAPLRPLDGGAYKAAAEAYASIERNDLAAAERAARLAATLRPDHAAPAEILADVLRRQDRAQDAERALDAAASRAAPHAPLFAQRAFLRLARKDMAGAAEDFRRALSLASRDEANARGWRLGLADALLAEPDQAAALAALDPLRDDPGYAVQARFGFALQAAGHDDAAEAAFQRAAASATTEDERATAARALAGLQSARGAFEQAAATLGAQIPRGTGCTLDLAYLALRAHDDEAALDCYRRMRDAGTLPESASLDAAYAAKRAAANDEAREFFRTGLDATAQNEVAKRFGLQREIDALDRRFGLASGFALRAGRPESAGGTVGQGIAEATWQPGGVGYHDGRILQLLARVSANAVDAAAASSSNGSSTTRSLQGAVGMRWKPFSEVTLVGGVERLIKIGPDSFNDWLLRLAWSTGGGTDIDPVADHWWSWQAYAEAAYFVTQGRLVHTFEARGGQTWRGALFDTELLVTPFVGLAETYDAAERRRLGWAAGPGVALRRWYGGDAYRAPPHWAEWSLQYRWHLAGSARLSGLVLQLGWSL